MRFAVLYTERAVHVPQSVCGAVADASLAQW